MIIYHTTKGILVEEGKAFFLLDREWDELVNRDDLYGELLKATGKSRTDEKAGPASEPGPSPGSGLAGKPVPERDAVSILAKNLLPPIGKQEVWGAGVTYMRSREARKEESKDAGGGDFYQRVYDADRPELFFKANPRRCVGSGGKVRIRRDSAWNVPEPELTLMITSGAKIVGYTAGNDMSSRDIEGENPLYLPQAKTYDGSAALGPGIYVTDRPIASDTMIRLEVLRSGSAVFQAEVSINQMKREHTELVGYLFRECSFPDGCLLMTGTGIVPPNDFTLQSGDEIRIGMDRIGTLVNYVE